jgi:hypothetical protein
MAAVVKGTRLSSRQVVKLLRGLETLDASAVAVARKALSGAEITRAEAKLLKRVVRALDEEGKLARATGGLRRSAREIISPERAKELEQEFIELGGDPAQLRFNEGDQTGYLDREDVIYVRGDVEPLEGVNNPRSAMSSKAALGHELGHAAHRNTPLLPGAWNDEFRASYFAAKNLPGLSEDERIFLLLDAIDRAREARVPIKWNEFMKKKLRAGF